MSDIDPITVNPSGLTALINNLGRDCLPDQYLREFVKNSIEAIQRTEEKKGTILVDCNWPDWHYLDNKPIKISFTDNGDGMSPQQMEKLLNQLSASGSKASKHKHYGVGAKISAISRNPAGIKYESWQNGKGFMVYIYFDVKKDVYGLMRFTDENGKLNAYKEITNDIKPSIIKDHGTRVTLMGEKTSEDTMQRPESVKGTKDFWQFYYLNQRFFEIPKGIEIKVRCAYYYDLDKAIFNGKKNSINDPAKSNCLRVLFGQKGTLVRHKKKSGITELSDAKMHWWILNPDRKSNSREFIVGQTGVVKEDELFEITSGSSNRASHFGVIFSYRDVALLIEPNDNYEQDTTRRTIVKRDGSPMPWERWQDEFKENFPEEIKKFEDEVAKKLGGDDYAEKIKERLNKLLKYFKLGKYKRNSSGDLYISEDEVEALTGNIRTGDPKNQERKTTGGNYAGKIREMLSIYEKESNTRGVRVQADPFPKVLWCSLSEKTRDEGEMIDRAAKYFPEENLVKANRDFSGYEDVKKEFITEFGKTNENAPKIITQVVEEIFGQQLCEVVAGANQLKGRTHWTNEAWEKAISEEALTTAVGVRSNIVINSIREIKNRLRITSKERDVA